MPKYQLYQQPETINQVKKFESQILPEDYENDILEDIRQNNTKLGYGFGDVKIDEWLRFKPKEFWLNVGNPNVGKSYMVIYLLTRLARDRGLKFLIYSQENDISDIKQSIMQFWSKKTLYGMSDLEFRRYLELISDSFLFIDPRKLFSYKELLQQCEETMKTTKLSGFFIDPYNALKVDRDLVKEIGIGHEYHYEVSTELANFSHNKLSLIVNSHTVTEIQRGITDDGQTRRPMLSHVEGGGKFVAKCDTGTVMHRQIHDSENYDITEIHVMKIRTKRKGGKPTPWKAPIELRLSNNGCDFNPVGTMSDKGEQKMKPAPF